MVSLSGDISQFSLIVVTIPFNWINEMNVETSSNTSKNTEVKLNETQKKILEEIRNNPNVTKEMLSSLVGKGKTAIDNAIEKLKKNGFIKREGSYKTGSWIILK